MKYLILILATFVLSACNEDGGGDTSTTTPTPAVTAPVGSSNPSNVTSPVTSPVVTPVSSPSPAPVTSPVSSPVPAPVSQPSPQPQPVTVPTPPASVTKSSTFNGYTCDVLSTGYIWCTDGTTAVTSPQANFVDVQVGNGIACATHYEQSGTVTNLPASCNPLSNCTLQNSPTSFNTYCWSGSSSAPVAMNIQTQLIPTVTPTLPSPTSTWFSGPYSMSLDSSNRVCVEQPIFANPGAHTNNVYSKIETKTVCGTTISSQGYLQ